MTCRFCGEPLKTVFADFGAQPPSNAYLRPADLLKPEVSYPLRVYVCDACLLVQVPEFKASHEIFNADYAYFSGVSSSWLRHCENYAQRMIEERRLGTQSLVVELASNDGYLLQFFAGASIPCYGVEPSSSVAAAAQEKGIESIVDFFGDTVAAGLLATRGKADLMIANNVLAHVPDLNDFVAGIARLLHEDGVFTGEFPHVQELIECNAFDTIYHEHYSYFSLKTLQAVFAKAGLTLFDVDVLSTHGGSLRVYVCAESDNREDSASVEEVLSEELEFGLDSFDVYSKFADVSRRTGVQALRYLSEKKLQGESIFAYGAAAKASTFFNFCGINSILVEGIADITPSKIGKYMPLNGIPVISEDSLFRSKPDTILIMAWNWRDEIINRLSQKINFKCDLVTFIPELEVVSIND